MNPRILVLPLALALAACQSGQKKPENAAPQPYKFPHAMHVESGVACVECHAPILKANRLQVDAVRELVRLRGRLGLLDLRLAADRQEKQGKEEAPGVH